MNLPRKERNDRWCVFCVRAMSRGYSPVAKSMSVYVFCLLCSFLAFIAIFLPPPPIKGLSTHFAGVLRNKNCREQVAEYKRSLPSFIPTLFFLLFPGFFLFYFVIPLLHPSTVPPSNLYPIHFLLLPFSILTPTS